MDNPNFKLQSLRDFSAMDMRLMAASEEGKSSDKEPQSAERFRYMSDASLYD